MSCALLVCTPSSHASVLAAQASLPRHRGGIAARPDLPGSPAGSSCPLQCGAASRRRSVRDVLPPAARRVRSHALKGPTDHDHTDP